MNHKFYSVITLCVLLGVFFTVLGSTLSDVMAAGKVTNARFQMIFGFLGAPATPVPKMGRLLFPGSVRAIFDTAFYFFFFLQVGLLVRRIALCVGARSILPPSIYPALKRVLLVAFGLWFVVVLSNLWLRLIVPALYSIHAELALGAARVGQVVGSASMKVQEIIGMFPSILLMLFATSALALSFLLAELHSLGKDGVWPIKNRLRTDLGTNTD